MLGILITEILKIKDQIWLKHCWTLINLNIQTKEKRRFKIILLNIFIAKKIYRKMKSLKLKSNKLLKKIKIINQMYNFKKNKKI